jgi:hypothetical protein
VERVAKGGAAAYDDGCCAAKLAGSESLVSPDVGVDSRSGRPEHGFW